MHDNYGTLREFLAINGYEEGDDSPFLLFVGLLSRREFWSSRRYLEEFVAFDYLLDFLVIDYWYQVDDISIAILIEDPNKL